MTIKAKANQEYSVQLTLGKSGHTLHLWTHLLLTEALKV